MDKLKELQSGTPIDLRSKDCRYVFGVKGDNPMIIFGINPSTGKHPKENWDQTQNVIPGFVERNKCDGWILLNLYPYIATDSEEFKYIKNLNKDIRKDNLDIIEQVLQEYPNSEIWAAWGTLIEKHKELKDCLAEVIDVAKEYNCTWYHLGKRTKDNHPQHPLGLSQKSIKYNFDIDEYIKGL